MRKQYFGPSSLRFITRAEARFLIIDFLKKNLALQNFIINYKKHHCSQKDFSSKAIIHFVVDELFRRHLKFSELFTYSDIAFFWGDSDEGFMYWLNISKKWRERTRLFLLDFEF